MLIQEFCRVTGLSRDTVRFYVRRRLLTPRIGAPTRAAGGEAARPGNRYQVFDAAQVERARLIRVAQGLGFTLREIAALADAYERGALSPARKAAVLRAHLATLDARAAELAAMRRYLAAKLAWLERGATGPAPGWRPSRAAAGATAPSAKPEVKGRRVTRRA